MLAAMKINPEKTFLLVVCECLNAFDLFLPYFFHCIRFLYACVCLSNTPSGMRKAEQNLTGYTLRKLRAIRPGNTAGSHQESFIRKAHRRSFAAVKAMKMRIIQKAQQKKRRPGLTKLGRRSFVKSRKVKTFDVSELFNDP